MFCIDGKMGRVLLKIKVVQFRKVSPFYALIIDHFWVGILICYSKCLNYGL